MGLFDKLRKTGNTGMTSSEGGKVSLKKNPLQDETVRQYYEMIYGMRTSLAWSWIESTAHDSRARKYIELMLGGPCDEEKFRIAVELTNLARTDHPQTKLEIELKELNKSLKAEKKYFCTDKATVYKLCYKDLFDKLQNEYNSILDVISDDVKYVHFAEGLKVRIIDQYKNVDSIHVTSILRIIIPESFIMGNEIIKKVILELMLDIYNNRVNNPKDDLEDTLDVLGAMALRAIHFEKHGASVIGYRSITEDECRDYILRCKAYTKIINNHPFEKEEYTQNIVRCIKRADILGIRHTSYSRYDLDMWLLNVHNESYFIDAVCNCVWKEIAKEYTDRTNENGDNIGESQDPKDVVNMIADYFYN